MQHRSRLSRALRGLHHAIFNASRDGRSAEIAAWSNAIASLGLGAGTYVLSHSLPGTALVPVIAFVLLRAALAHRLTVWIAASLGTLAVAALGGGLAWLFAHVIEIPAVPSLAAIFVAVLSALVPAWAYARLAQRRGANIRDSLVDPISVPPSHG
jgi:hypothetical protein